MTGCIRKLVANEHEYVLSTVPSGDVLQGFDIREYQTTTNVIQILRTKKGREFCKLQKLKCNGNEVLVIRLEHTFGFGFNDKN